MILHLLAGMVLAGAAASTEPASLSPQAVLAVEHQQQLYIAMGGARQVGVYDVDSAKIVRTVEVPSEPTSLALSGGGRWLYVTSGHVEGRVCVVDTETGRITREIPVGYGPTAATLDARRNVLYICNRFDNDVWAIDVANGKCLGKASAVREPIAAALTPDGQWLYVGNHLPAGAINVGAVGCEVSVIDTATMHARASVQLPNGSTGLRGMAASPDGKYVYVSHILARYTVPTTQLDRGWMNTNALSIIDAATHKLLDTVLLDDVDRGAANPWAIACSDDGKTIFVTHAGTDELSVIDVDAMLAKIKDHPSRQRAGGKASGAGTSYGGGAVTQIPNQLSFLKGVRQRVRLKGKGPRALAVLGGKAYVVEYFSGTMTVVDTTQKSIATAAVSLGSQLPLTGPRRGEMLFNDASLCFQQWQSCASCHPDARVDALNWDLLNDGIGNPKNTKNMLLAHRTPPAMITGVRPHAEYAVRSGFRHILFAECQEADAAAIDAYLSGLQPAPSPYLVKGKLIAAAQRGKILFRSAGCASCHTGALLTDLQKYDVATADGVDEGTEFDTPSLVEAWRTGPYLYDGRAATIREVLARYNPDDLHGVTSDLSAEAISDLAAYVLSQ